MSVDPLGRAVPTDPAVLVTGQRLDDEVSPVPRDHHPALCVAVSDGCSAHVSVALKARIERQSYRCGAIYSAHGILDADRNPDLGSGITVRTPGTDAGDGRNPERVNTVGSGRCGSVPPANVAALAVITAIRRSMCGSHE